MIEGVSATMRPLSVLITLHFSVVTLHFSVVTLHFSSVTLHFSGVTIHFSGVILYVGRVSGGGYRYFASILCL